MRRDDCLIVALFSLFIVSSSLKAQFAVNGSASSMGGNCYQITPDVFSSSGSIWNTDKIDISSAFDISAKLYFGYHDLYQGTGAISTGCGADGIVFVLQQVSTSVGSSGQGIGYGGISPSLGVEFDTFKNSYDPTYDHIAILKNGNVDHTSATTNLAGPVQASSVSNDIKDSAEHWARFTWDPATDSLKVYFDCILRITYKGDIINSIFNNDPNVYWGFTAATGGCSNFHRVCIGQATFSANSSNGPGGCVDDSISFSSVIDPCHLNCAPSSWKWTFGDPSSGSADTSLLQNPKHLYSTDGTYTVTLIAGDNCFKDTLLGTVDISLPPTFTLSPNVSICQGQSTVLSIAGSGSYIYKWYPYGGGQLSYVAPYITQTFNIKVTNGSCTKTDSINVFVVNYPQWYIAGNTSICYGTSASLTTVGLADQYQWSTGNNTPVLTASPTVNAVYSATATNGGMCSNTQTVAVKVTHVIANAGPDMSICYGDKAQFSGSGGGFYNWIPAFYLSSTKIYNPVASPLSTNSYSLVTVVNNCRDTDDVNITVYPDNDLIAGKDTTIYYGEKTTLLATANAPYFLWTPATGLSCDTCTKIIIQPVSSITYSVMATDIYGCEERDTVRITVIQVQTLFIPAAFSPGHVNDVFYAKGNDIDMFEMTIYDRWGNKLFETQNINNGWNGTFHGKLMKQDVYVYLVKGNWKNGVDFYRTGTIVLLR